MRYIWIVICGLILGACQPSEPERSPLLVETSAWKLQDGDSNAAILWQRAEPRKRPTGFSGPANSGFIATEHDVVYQSIQGADQPHDWLIGLDLRSGHETWRFSGEVPGYSKNMITEMCYIRSVEDGYVFTSFDVVTKIDNSGQFVWRQDAFPSHEICPIFYDGGETLYIPTLSMIYQLDKAHGQIQTKTPIKNLLGFFGDRVALLEQVDPDASMAQSNSPIKSLKILDRQTNQVLSNLSFDEFMNSIFVHSAIMNSPILGLDQNIFVVYDSPIAVDSTKAYDITSGKRLWTLDRHIDGSPIILNHQLVMFADSALEIYDLESGKLRRRIPMERYENGALDMDVPSPLRVWLAGYGDIIVVNFRATQEIVAVQLKT